MTWGVEGGGGGHMRGWSHGLRSNISDFWPLLERKMSITYVIRGEGVGEGGGRALKNVLCHVTYFMQAP